MTGHERRIRSVPSPYYPHPQWEWYGDGLGVIWGKSPVCRQIAFRLPGGMWRGRTPVASPVRGILTGRGGEWRSVSFFNLLIDK